MAQDVTIPQIGESVATVFISRFLAQPGDFVNEGDPIVELDSDKASMEVPAPAAGKITEHLVEEGDEVEIGATVARLDTDAKPEAGGEASSSDDSASDTSESDSPAEEASDADEGGDGTRAGPAARAAATESDVDLASVKGSGKGGRVTSRDVGSASASGGTSQSAPGPDAGASPEGRSTRVKMSPLRRTIARRLVEAQQNAAMLTTFNEIDMSAVMALRSRYKGKFTDDHGIKLGFMSFFVKAVIEGLKAYPAVNAQIDDDAILYKHYYNIGIAVSGPKGLVVPVVRDADQLSFAGVEKAIAELGGKARDNKLQISDFQDGTFTITNGGIFGSMMSTPILNPPQVGILGMHNIVERAVVVDGEVVVRPMMYVALSYDHRIIDGREAVSFLVRVKECIEDPERILLEV